jgi:thiamine kinase-like enzyme
MVTFFLVFSFGYLFYVIFGSREFVTKITSNWPSFTKHLEAVAKELPRPVHQIESTNMWAADTLVKIFNECTNSSPAKREKISKILRDLKDLKMRLKKSRTGSLNTQVALDDL